MSAMTLAIVTTQGIVRRVERMGLNVTVANVYAAEPENGDSGYSTLTLMIEQKDRTPEVAAMLGLVLRGIQPYKDEAIQAFDGIVAGVHVTMQHNVPAAMLAVTR